MTRAQPRQHRRFRRAAFGLPRMQALRAKTTASFALIAILVAACAPTQLKNPAETGWADARQMVVVITPDWNADHGVLRSFALRDGRWRAQGAPFDVTIGHAGSAWGLGLHAAQHNGPTKKEGDGRSPAGVFAIGSAFGYATIADTALKYRALSETDYCVDVSTSAWYNRIVDTRNVGVAAVAGSTEPMRRDLHLDGDQRYRLGFVIGSNPDNLAQAGSCIFGHLWKSLDDTTTGCTAMSDASMQTLLAWLRGDAHPVFVLLPRAEYARLQSTWQLPEWPQ